jgi:hypothetical protein
MKIRSLKYQPPGPRQIQHLKEALGYNNRQMAALHNVAPTHWRKHTGGPDPRPISYTKLFHAAALLELTPHQVEKIYQRMRDIGAQVLMERET